jgi:hypothetical protein
MATTTPNYGWVVPTSTDLVKDGATAIETLGDSIDASFVGLKGGTTGQVLSKSSGTDLAFTWVAQDDSNAIQNAIVDAKGDLIAATANDTPARLPVGTNGQYLTADSTAGTGLAWTTLSANGWTLINTGNTALSGTTTTISSIPGTYNMLAIFITGASFTSSNSYMKLLPNGAASSVDNVYNTYPLGSTLQANQTINNDGYMLSVTNQLANNTGNQSVIYIPNYANTSAYKVMSGQTIYQDASNYRFNTLDSIYKVTSAITSIGISASGQTFNGGNVYVYGVK